MVTTFLKRNLGFTYIFIHYGQAHNNHNTNGMCTKLFVEEHCFFFSFVCCASFFFHSVSYNEKIALLMGPLLLFCLSALVVSTASAKDVNILLIVADDMGYNDLSSYGSPTIVTPNIDAIANQGAKFTQFYQGAPLCTPARAAMLTGRLPIRSGIYTEFEPPVDELFRVFYPTSEGCLPETEISVAQALQPKYSTSMIGKW